MSMSATATRAPRAASRVAVAAPMPRAAPVTRAALPSSRSRSVMGVVIEQSRRGVRYSAPQSAHEESERMSEMEQQVSPPPIVRGEPVEVSDGVFVIPDGRVPLVPNVGFVVGTRAVLVVDTGMSLDSAAYVLGHAKRLADGKPLYLTVTHFHPEHGFGAQVFADEATIVYNREQRDELRLKGAGYIEMFKGIFGPHVVTALEGVELIDPHEVYDGETEIDLGGHVVTLRTFGRAHTGGDQVVLVDGRVLFGGDLFETRMFPIVPYFPPDDVDVDGSAWIAVLDELLALDARGRRPGPRRGDGRDADPRRARLPRLRPRRGGAAQGGAERPRTRRSPRSSRRRSRAGPSGRTRSGSASPCAASTPRPDDRRARERRGPAESLSRRGRGGATRAARRVRRVRERQLEPGRAARDRSAASSGCGRACREAGFEQVRTFPTSGNPVVLATLAEPGRGRADDPHVRALRRTARRPGGVADAAVRARDPRRPHVRARDVRQQGADRGQPERGARLPRARRVGAVQPRLRDRGRRGANRRAAGRVLARPRRPARGGRAARRRLVDARARRARRHDRGARHGRARLLRHDRALEPPLRHLRRRRPERRERARATAGEPARRERPRGRGGLLRPGRRDEQHRARALGGLRARPRRLSRGDRQPLPQRRDAVHAARAGLVAADARDQRRLGRLPRRGDPHDRAGDGTREDHLPAGGRAGPAAGHRPDRASTCGCTPRPAPSSSSRARWREPPRSRCRPTRPPCARRPARSRPSGAARRSSAARASRCPRPRSWRATPGATPS